MTSGRDFAVTFTNSEHSPVRLGEGANLSEHLTIENSPVLFGCRTGICGTCVVEVDATNFSALPPPSEDEREILELYAPENPHARLACQIDLQADVVLKYLGSGDV